MSEKNSYKDLMRILDTKKAGDHAWFLSLLDEETQRTYEKEHLQAVMQMLKGLRIRPHKNAVKQAYEEIAKLGNSRLAHSRCPSVLSKELFVVHV